MRLLLINTAGGEGVVALADETRILVQVALPARGTSEALMPAIRSLFAVRHAVFPIGAVLGGQVGQADNVSHSHHVSAPDRVSHLDPVSLGGLTAVAVVTGPGSFTGVRVGLSAAKGLCDGLGAGMIALSRLALVAAAGPGAGRNVAILDAGRGEFYTGVYDRGIRIAETLMGEAQARALLATGQALTSEIRVAEKLDLLLVPEPGPETIRRLAVARMLANQWSDPATTDANYLRRTDAEILINP